MTARAEIMLSSSIFIAPLCLKKAVHELCPSVHYQEPAPMTEDLLEEQSEVLAKLGTSAEGAHLRARMQSACLLSDMESFKVGHTIRAWKSIFSYSEIKPRKSLHK